MEISQKTKNGTIISPSNSTPGYIVKNKNTNLKRYRDPNVHSSIIYTSQGIEATSVSHQQMNSKDGLYIDTHNGILLSNKKNETLPSATSWMDLEGILSEVSQKEKDK